MQVILYKVSSETIGSSDDRSSSEVMKKWLYVGPVRAHTHDVRALTVAVPISREGELDFLCYNVIWFCLFFFQFLFYCY